MSKTTLITGASSGIGLGITEVLAEAGYSVHAVARRADRLEELSARTGCKVHALDVTDSAALERLVAEITPEVVICNAGRAGGFDGIANTSAEDLQQTISLNVTATLDLIRLCLPGMIARRSGHVVTISSVAALYPSISSLYGGSKAAIQMIAQNLRLELRGTGIRVTDIRPGRVTSEIYKNAFSDPAKIARATDTGIRELQAREIGDAVLYAVSAPSRLNVSAIELQPVEQTYGGLYFDPV